MLNKAITISVGILSLTTSAALATGLTERMQSQRMTVVRVDPIKGQFLCAEHQRWTKLAKADVSSISAGDIISLERGDGNVWRVRTVRKAADELGSVE